jgi:hypothetical protein
MTKFAENAFELNNDVTTSGALARNSVNSLTGGNNPLKGGNNPLKGGNNPVKGGKSKKVRRMKKSKGSRKNKMRKTTKRSTKK